MRELDDVCTRALALDGLREATGRGDLHLRSVVIGNGLRWAVVDAHGKPLVRGDGWRSTEAEALAVALEEAADGQ